MSEPRAKEFLVRQYETNAEFEDGLNAMQWNSYRLHSWQLQVEKDTRFFVCIFERTQVKP